MIKMLFGVPVDWMLGRSWIGGGSKGGGGGGTPQASKEAKALATNKIVPIADTEYNLAKSVTDPYLQAVYGNLAGTQTGMATDQQAAGNQQMQQYLSLFQPLEYRMVLDSMGYDNLPETEAAQLLSQMTDYQKNQLIQQHVTQLGQLQQMQEQQQYLQAQQKEAGEGSTTEETTTTQFARPVASDGWVEQVMRGFRPLPRATNTPATTTKTTTKGAEPADPIMDDAYFEQRRQELEAQQAQELANLDSQAGLIAGQRGAERSAIDAEAGRAKADVSQAHQANQGILARTLQRMGIDPNSMRSLSAGKQNAARAALDEAGTGTAVRNTLQKQMQADRANTAAYGQNAIRNSQGFINQAVNTGNSVGQNATQAVMGSLPQKQLAVNTYGTAANALNNVGSIQAQANQPEDNSGIWSALGSVAGAALPLIFGSSKDLKTKKKKKLSDKVVLERLRKLPLNNWAYKEGIPNRTGMASTDPSQQHLGPMAEDMQEQFGVGDGKTIHPADQGGIIMAAIKALDKKVDKLEGRAA